MKVKEEVVGFGKPTGVFVKKIELDILVQIIRSKKPPITTVTRNPSTESYDVSQQKDLSIQDVTEQLRKSYNLPEGIYGINKYGEFILFNPME